MKINRKFTPETVETILGMISRGVLQPTKLARGAGISYNGLLSWLVRSNAGDESLLVEYNGETMQFARAYTLARKLAMLELRGMAEQRALAGTTEPSMKDGQVVFRLDYRAVPLDRETRIICGFHPDALYINEQGEVEPVQIHTAAPIGLILRVLEQAFPKDYRPGTMQELSISGGVSVGVQHLPPRDYSGPPPPIPPPPVRPELEVIDVDVDDLIGDSDVQQIAPPTPVNIVIAPVIPEPASNPKSGFEPEPAVVEPQAVRSGRPLSALEADLLRRMRGTPEERSKPL